MRTLLFVFEFLGTTELLVIALVALILFGPRKLPEIGRTVGKSIAEFKRASDDFKRTWEFEVELERRKTALEGPEAAHDPAPAADASPGESDDTAAQPDTAGETVARTPATYGGASETADFADEGAWDAATGRAGSPAQRRHADEDEINAS